MTTPACPSYAGYRFPAEIISHAVWLYFRFPLSLRMVDELLAVSVPPAFSADRAVEYSPVWRGGGSPVSPALWGAARQ